MSALTFSVVAHSLQFPFVRFLHRTVAALSVGLVLLLTTLAASPELHEHVHDADHHAEAEDTCAVVLFASGVSLSVCSAAVPLPSVAWQRRAPHGAEEIFLATPRYLRHPERGPPVS